MIFFVPRGCLIFFVPRGWVFFLSREVGWFFLSWDVGWFFSPPRGWVIFFYPERLCDFFLSWGVGFFCPESLGFFVVPVGSVIFFVPRCWVIFLSREVGWFFLSQQVGWFNFPCFQVSVFPSFRVSKFPCFQGKIILYWKSFEEEKNSIDIYIWNPFNIFLCKVWTYWNIYNYFCILQNQGSKGLCQWIAPLSFVEQSLIYAKFSRSCISNFSGNCNRLFTSEESLSKACYATD